MSSERPVAPGSCQASSEWTRKPFGPIVAGTLTTPDLQRSVDAYRSCLGYELISQGVVAAGLAVSLGAPGCTGSRVALLGCRDDRIGLVRMIECAASTDSAPLRHLGWAALELAVTDAEGVAGRLDPELFAVIGSPTPLASTGGALRALQVVGPAGEVLYLTERLRELEGFDLPIPATAVDRVFVAVLASHAVEEVRDFLEVTCGARTASDHEVAIGVVNRAFRLPPGTTHRLSSVQLAGQSLIEIDEYPRAATKAALTAGGLPSGVAVVTIAVPPEAFGALPGGEGTVACHCEPPYDGRPSRTIRLPTGEMLELVARC